MNESIRTLLERRSIRQYDSKPVPDDLLDIVLEAGLYAPSGMNYQCCSMVAVRDPETIALMSRLNARVMGTDSDPFYGAPCVIVVLGDPTVYRCWREDGSLIMGNLMNAAYAVGLGSCWINRAAEVFDSPEGKELLRAWGLPEHLQGVGNCILGYPACDHPEARPRKEGRVRKIG